MAGKKLWVGIDVGKQFHHACAVDERGKTVFSRKVKNRQVAIEELITRTATKAGGGDGEVVWALDMTSGSAALLVALLVGTGQPVLAVPGRLVNRMSGAFAGEGKTDAKDARTIAETARLRGDLAPVTMPDQIVGDLQVLTARREDLMADWVRGVNRLRELLGSIFPGLEEAFDYSTRSALILLTGFQAPASLRSAGEADVAQFLRTHRAWAPGIGAMAATAVAVAGEQDLALPGEAVTAPLIARLAGQLLDLDREIKDLDKQLGARFAQHPHAEIITSFPGVGLLTGARVLAEIGDDPTRFTDARGLKQYAGAAPITRASGRTKTVRVRRVKNQRLAATGYVWAFAALRPSPGARRHYDARRRHGDTHTAALRHLWNRLLVCLHHCLQTQGTYQEHEAFPQIESHTTTAA